MRDYADISRALHEARRANELFRRTRHGYDDQISANYTERVIAEGFRALERIRTRQQESEQ